VENETGKKLTKNYQPCELGSMSLMFIYLYTGNAWPISLLFSVVSQRDVAVPSAF